MKRLGIFAVTALAFVAIFGSTALAARPAASFTAHANHAEQGGSLRVAAAVRHGDHKTAFSASAVVHFASGDVSVDLTRNGRSLTAHGKVPVAANAAVGPVAVDVTINYGLTTQVVSVMGVIQPPDAND
jgi:hypothetical protein